MKRTTRSTSSNDRFGRKDSDPRSDGSGRPREETVLVARHRLQYGDAGWQFDSDRPVIYHDRYRGTTPVCNVGSDFVLIPTEALPDRATRCERCRGDRAQRMGMGDLGRQLLDMDAEDLAADDDGGDES